MRVKKEFYFDAAHRLPLYKGKCHNLHGHTWKLVVVIEGQKMDDSGMVLDFNEISHFVNPIIEELDHSTIVWVEDTPLVNYLISQGLKRFVMHDVPTSENLARLLFYKLKNVFGEKLKQIEIYESPTSCAIYSKDDEEDEQHEA